MRVVTWNIGGGYVSGPQKTVFDEENIDYFINQLAHIAPDIICFQEIHFSTKNNQSEIIAKALGFEFYTLESIADSHIKDGEKLSISVVSKYPIISSKFHKLSNPNLQFIWKGEKVFSHDKGFIEAIIDYNGKNVKVLSGHMVPFRKFEKNFLSQEFKYIRDEVEDIICSIEIPTIVGVDMNCEDVYELLPNVFEKGFNFILDDIPTTPKNRKYDKILISNDWKFVDSKIVEGLADHYMCFADIELM